MHVNFYKKTPSWANLHLVRAKVPVSCSHNYILWLVLNWGRFLGTGGSEDWWRDVFQEGDNTKPPWMGEQCGWTSVLLHTVAVLKECRDMFHQGVDSWGTHEQ